jgi:hypothetical protein
MHGSFFIHAILAEGNESFLGDIFCFKAPFPDAM